VPKEQTPAVRPWRKLGEEIVHAGYRRIARRRYELPDRSEADFEVVVNPDTVAVVALTPEESVVLVREYRPGPERFLLELPGGAIDEGESPMEAATRELVEETGYEGTLRSAGSLWAGAYSSHRRHAFVATDCYRVAERWPEEHEFIEVDLVSVHDFRLHVQTGELTDVGLAYLGLEALGLLGGA
jgi:ADP-ribose pyrophosphatase